MFSWKNSLNIQIIRILYLAAFLIPLNIFIIGNWWGTGLQWAFFRFQITTLGSSIIPITNALSYVITGQITGKTAYSEEIFFYGVLLVIISFILVLSNKASLIKKAGLLTITGGLFLLFSLILQYGILLHGPAGISIPIGLPLIFILGIILVYNEPVDGAPENQGRADPSPMDTYEAISLCSYIQEKSGLTTDKWFRIVFQNKEYLLIFGLCCLLFNQIFLNYNQIIFSAGPNGANDILLQYSFWRSFFATSILGGSGIPLWNPYVFSGCPFIGNPQSGIFYPFTWLFIIFHSEALFGYLFFIDVFLIGTFTFLYARTLGLGRYGSLISAITFMLCGAVVPRIYAGHLSNVDAIVWLPLMLFFFEKAWKDRPILNTCGAGLCLALMCLAGNFQYFLISAVVAVIYVIGRNLLFDERLPITRKIWNVSVTLSITFIVCLIVSAIPMLPVWEFSHYSNRADGVNYEFSSEYSLPPVNLITLVLPGFFGYPDTGTTLWGKFFWEFSCYAGLLPLLLALTGLLFHKTRYRFIFLVLALLSFSFAVGKYSVIYPIFYQYFPFFSTFRVPPRILYIGLFSLAILAGIGADALPDIWKTNTRNAAALFRNLLIISVLCVAGLSILICFFWKTLGISSESIPGIILAALIYCAGTIVLAGKPLLVLDPAWVRQVLVGLIIIDLFLFGLPFVSTQPTDQVVKNPGFIPILKNESDEYFRVHDATGLFSQYIAYKNNLFLSRGYDPTYLREYQEFFMRNQKGNVSQSILDNWGINHDPVIDPEVLRLLNVRYVITDIPVEKPGLQLVYNHSVYMYRLNSTYPRSYIVAASEFSNATPLILKPAQISSYTPNRITIDADTPADSYLITSEIWYPGWTATDNGKTTEVLKNNGIFRSVHLSPGKHEIVFTYFPKVFTLS